MTDIKKVDDNEILIIQILDTALSEIQFLMQRLRKYEAVDDVTLKNVTQLLRAKTIILRKLKLEAELQAQKGLN